MTNSIDREKLLGFLFSELDEEERRTLEERFFDDEGLFYEIMELEDELVDRYVGGDLPADERARFEKSLAAFPERREKVLNATALRTYVEEEAEDEKAAAPVAAATPTLWERISDFFSFRMPVMQYATAALLLLLTGGMVFLIYERVRLDTEMADIRDEQQKRLEEIERQEQDLERKLREIERRERELGNVQTDGPEVETPAGTPDNAELERVRKEKRKAVEEQKRLRDRIEEMKRRRTVPPPRAPRATEPPRPVIATITLLPLTGSKGPSGGGVGTVRADAGTIVATFQVPADPEAETYTVTYKGSTLARDVRPKDGTITVRISTRILSASEDNLIYLTGDNGRRITYGIRLQD